jgi:tRNA (cytidine/uridine-2'-O-)-methyltransferase
MTRTRPYLHVVLHQPEIPANAGNIARLCGAAELRLHLIHPLGFKVDDKHLKRAGLDYWPEIDLRYHENLEAFRSSLGDERMIAFSSQASQDYTKAKVRQGDYLIFGKETVGLPKFIKEAYPCYRIPIWGKVRSLNLSTAAGIVVYHYLHQMGRF